MVPTTLADLERMIRDQVMEDLHLDYKDSRALGSEKKDEIVKDVSAFANSDGGVIVYGVCEGENHLPARVDDGVELKKGEWLERILMSGIAPRLSDVRIHAIPLTGNKFGFAVEVLKSFRGPHQAADKKYYKRFNFSSVPMEDYEIRDLRLRRREVPPLVRFTVEAWQGSIAVFDVSNPGEISAEDVRFEFPPAMIWPDTGIPEPLQNGIRRLAPGQKLRFTYLPFHQILAQPGHIGAQFPVVVSYYHPENDQRMSEECKVDFEAYRGSLVVRTAEQETLRDVVKELQKLTKVMEQVGKRLEPLDDMVWPSGLRLSVSTLRSIQRIGTGGNPEPMDVGYCTPEVIAEVLEVDQAMAHQIYRGLNRPDQRLEDLPGMTTELLVKLRRCFRLPERDSSK